MNLSNKFPLIQKLIEGVTDPVEAKLLREEMSDANDAMAVALNTVEWVSSVEAKLTELRGENEPAGPLVEYVDTIIKEAQELLGMGPKDHLTVLRHHESMVAGVLAFKSRAVSELLSTFDTCPVCFEGRGKAHKIGCRLAMAATLQVPFYPVEAEPLIALKAEAVGALLIHADKVARSVQVKWNSTPEERLAASNLRTHVEIVQGEMPGC